MALRFVNQGEQYLLEVFVGKTPVENLKIGLFANDVSHAEALTEGDFTEASFTGYAAQTLTGASWGSASGGDPASIAYAQQTFTSTADQTPETIYGYMYVTASGGKLIAYEKFSAPVTIENSGDAIKITPTLTAQDSSD